MVNRACRKQGVFIIVVEGSIKFIDNSARNQRRVDSMVALGASLLGMFKGEDTPAERAKVRLLIIDELKAAGLN